MMANRLQVRPIFFLLASLLMVATGLLLYWLYLGSVEREKIRLMDLALLHVQQFETINGTAIGGEYRTGVQKARTDRIRRIFDAQTKHHRFGETGEILFVGGRTRHFYRVFLPKVKRSFFPMHMGECSLQPMRRFWELR